MVKCCTIKMKCKAQYLLHWDDDRAMCLCILRWGQHTHTTHNTGLLGHACSHQVHNNLTTQYSRVQSLDLWLLTAGSCLYNLISFRWSALTGGLCSQTVSYRVRICECMRVILINIGLQQPDMYIYIVNAIGQPLNSSHHVSLTSAMQLCCVWSQQLQSAPTCAYASLHLMQSMLHITLVCLRVWIMLEQNWK